MESYLILRSKQLVEKKGKDKGLIKNWRPISLINVDTKIVSKALAKRQEHNLPDLIHYNQIAYVKGRSIFDAARTIDDVLEYTKQSEQSGILVTIDFEKHLIPWIINSYLKSFTLLILDHPLFNGFELYIQMFRAAS